MRLFFLCLKEKRLQSLCIFIFIGVISVAEGFAPRIDILTTSTEPTTTTPDPATLPYFRSYKNRSSESVTKGSDAFLECQVFRLGDRTVSWVRKLKGDIQLLTFGLHTYHQDVRYELAFIEPNEWNLRITNVSENDKGFYECQVSSHPPKVLQVCLDVKVPNINILDVKGDPIKEKFYEVGSSIVLQCLGASTPEGTVLIWRKGVNVVTNSTTDGQSFGYINNSIGDNSSLWLHIPAASANDTGNYSCSASTSRSTAYVRLHVLDADESAPMQHITNSAITFVIPFRIYISVFFCAYKLCRSNLVS